MWMVLAQDEEGAKDLSLAFELGSLMRNANCLRFCFGHSCELRKWCDDSECHIKLKSVA
ncbi:MAG: hypothetical protein ACI8W8_003220 [Rhodothermales bacterium]|jgi:hypothetical protein